MKTGARLAAAIDILEQVVNRHRPAAEALSDWGRQHRFAGSGDRSAIGHVVYDVLRRRSSLAHQAGSDSIRALVLAAAGSSLGVPDGQLVASAGGERHSIAPLTEVELASLARPVDPDAPAHIQADIPEWLAGSFERAFAIRVIDEGKALARRAPVDLRVNTLKSTRERVLTALASTGAVPTPWSPIGVRIPAPSAGRRTPNVEAEAGHGKGWFEVQDEASQLAALMTGAAPREQVLDLCAGSGGKSLALAAMMENSGQIYAYDSDRVQLRPIFERLKRAGARNVQVLRAGDEPALDTLGARFDVVLVDAPCTGSGTWRRRPDAKWRLKSHNLETRVADQRAVLQRARVHVKPGGRLVYVTCSVLPEENVDQMHWFLNEAQDFQAVPYRDAWPATMASDAPASADGASHGLLLTPAQHDTDGFFIAVLRRGS